MLEACDFIHFPFEFWHFNQGEAMATSSATCFGPDPQTNRVAAAQNPLSPLNPLPVIEREIATALRCAENKLSQEAN